MVPQELFFAPKKNTENKCYCANDDLAMTSDGFCSISGIIDMSKCNKGAPLVLSSPHYLYSDDILINATVITKPSEELHSSSLEIDPVNEHTCNYLRVNILNPFFITFRLPA